MLGIQPTYVADKDFFAVFRLLRVCIPKLMNLKKFKILLLVSDSFERHSYAILTRLGWKIRFFCGKNPSKSAKKRPFFGN